MKLFILFVGIIVIGLNKNRAFAECCFEEKEFFHGCKGISTEHNVIIGRGWCASLICKDGTPKSTSFCGYQSCNIFGCNCGGGCRNNHADSWDEATRIYSENYLK